MRNSRRSARVRAVLGLAAAPLMVFAELMDLKKKWEEDKAKVEKLRESRRFKPY